MTVRSKGLLGQYAGFVSRGAALVVDLGIVLTISVVLYWSIALPLRFFTRVSLADCRPGLQQQDLLSLIICLGAYTVWGLLAIGTLPTYFLFFTTMTGQTIGKHLLGLRVVRLDGFPMTLRRATLRLAGMIASALPVGLGYAWTLVDDRRQAFHDKLAGTCVVYAWRAEQNDVLLGRLRGFFSRHARGTGKVLLELPAGKDYDLITIAVRDLDRLDPLLDRLVDLARDGLCHVPRAGLFAKDGRGSVGQVGDPMLTQVRLGAAPLAFPPPHLPAAIDDVPPNSFVIALLVERKDAGSLVDVLSGRAATLVHRYDFESASNAER